MKKLLLALVLLAVPLAAQELVTLTVPETTPNNTAYHLSRIVLDYDAGVIDLALKGVNSETKHCVYDPATSPTGASLLTGLNKANLSSAYAANATTGSLKQRIYHRLVVMGEASAVCGSALTGSLAGSVP